jgi:glucose-6-phosphate isomerase
MLTSNIFFKNFKEKKKNSKLAKKLYSLLKNKNEVLKSLSKNYNDSFDEKFLNKYKKNNDFRVIGMGGSTLGTQTIFQFLNEKIKKKFSFIDNLTNENKNKIKNKKVNLIISKSGNTIETVVNTNLLVNRNDTNIFITENKKSSLHRLAEKLKSDIIHHNNFIGGRYSVLSEVGMLPAELMGLNSKKFRCLNSLIKNKKFLNNLISNVNSTIHFAKNKKYNSVIINYDQKSENLFNWYQQLIAESLGKKKKGILPIVSNMPKDNHSVMQLYLDGFDNNFFTFFYVKEKNTPKINSHKLLQSEKYLKGKSLNSILYAQKKATENVFERKKIPFRSFEIKKRDEKSLGELFCFFILETILLGKALKLNPYDQPAVELIKMETKKLLI